MNNIRLNSISKNAVRIIVAAFTCALLFFSSAYPAAAIGSQKSDPTQGEANLNDIQRMTDTSVPNPPLTLKEVQERTQPEKGGLNEVQGAADLDKMKNPENAKGTSFVEEVTEGLRKVTK
ncbi:hypothetical protein HC931_15785 [Candidatus Gracilibacteria bacterium]|nr:hypothetical protein [Candidatus Gracilibacteria bacterium]NJM89907.1 hypothetical protein [Hydrococcus sp. RU_2_2]NJP19989.1 hypothetical protein [Hydrococcus sp. CRU_1_1]